MGNTATQDAVWKDVGRRHVVDIERSVANLPCPTSPAISGFAPSAASQICAERMLPIV